MDINMPLNEVTIEDKMRHARNMYLSKLFERRLFKLDRRVCEDRCTYFDDIYNIITEREKETPLQYKDIQILFGVGNGAEQYDPNYKDNKLKIRRISNDIPSIEYQDEEESEKHIRFGKHLGHPLKFITLPVNYLINLYDWKDVNKPDPDKYDIFKLEGCGCLLPGDIIHHKPFRLFKGATCDYYCKKVDYVKSVDFRDSDASYIDRYVLRCRMNRFEMINFGGYINELCIYAAVKPKAVPSTEKAVYTDIKEAHDPIEAREILDQLYKNSHHVVPLFSISFDSLYMKPEMESGFDFKFNLY